jgi:hypothetical protein
MVWFMVMMPESPRSEDESVKLSSRFASAFKGWQVGLAIIFTAILSFAVVTPRPAMPEEIPLPIPRHGALKQLFQEESRRASLAVQQELPFETRQVGEYFRQVGLATAADDPTQLEHFQRLINSRIRESNARPEESWLRLRAYQTQDFLRELENFERTGIESSGLQELGGDFVRVARQAGWIRSQGSRQKLLIDEDIRRILFRKRWNDILGIKTSAFAISLDEQRAWHAFLFSHPIVPITPGFDERLRQRKADEYTLRKVTAYGPIDPHYPTDYARGLLLLRLDQYDTAVLSFVKYLENNPDGPHTLRVRNSLRYAQERLHEVITQ